MVPVTPIVTGITSTEALTRCLCLHSTCALCTLFLT